MPQAFAKNLIHLVSYTKCRHPWISQEYGEDLRIEGLFRPFRTERLRNRTQGVALGWFVLALSGLIDCPIPAPQHFATGGSATVQLLFKVIQF
jgi:hypothetical protein